MGVSGSGKSTVGAALARRLRVPFEDADDLHPAANIAKMSRGEPLDDNDRYPWLETVGEWLADHEDGGVIACSALKRKYRDQLRHHAPTVRFLHLEGSREVIERRQASRPGHFMPASLLDLAVRRRSSRSRPTRTASWSRSTRVWTRSWRGTSTSGHRVRGELMTAPARGRRRPDRAGRPRLAADHRDAGRDRADRRADHRRQAQPVPGADPRRPHRRASSRARTSPTSSTSFTTGLRDHRGRRRRR